MYVFPFLFLDTLFPAIRIFCFIGSPFRLAFHLLDIFFPVKSLKETVVRGPVLSWPYLPSCQPFLAGSVFVLMTSVYTLFSWGCLRYAPFLRACRMWSVRVASNEINVVRSSSHGRSINHGISSCHACSFTRLLPRWTCLNVPANAMDVQYGVGGEGTHNIPKKYLNGTGEISSVENQKLVLKLTYKMC